jgi:4-hydroxythreonine-4-phosphate dehydrogenase
MKNKIIIIIGDPNSINSELIFKSWKKINNSIKKKIYLVANYTLIKKQFKKLKYLIKIKKLNHINDSFKDSELKIIDVNLKFDDPFKVKKKFASPFVKNSLNLGHKLALKKDVQGIINCAVDKSLLNKDTGVTEFLASKCNVKNNSEVMLIKNEKLAVCPITTHINIKQVAQSLSIFKITNKILTINKWFRQTYNKKPKIGILGLNPHNAELRNNSEEKKIIMPAILKLKKKGISVKGPLVADTIFINDYKKYDIIVGMFHDQVLIPFKTLYKFDAINITLGLKYLRVSPDHGIAKNLIGTNKADATSLLKCINFVNKYKK